jgi:tetratricopeptide (TPR) repeat protein
VAWYGLHPAMAETVNYVIQRGDIFCSFGVVAALAVYARFPALRRTGLYLLPFAFGLLSKPPAAVFPLLLFLYIVLFEQPADWQKGMSRFLGAALSSLPSIVVCIALMVLQSALTPKTYTPSILSAYSYIVTQPYVLLRYFGSLFLPIHLNVDTDLQPFPSINALALLGFLFVALLLAAAWFSARRRTLRPVSFGLLWFLIASLPTSLYRLSEVENDHRMFLPFVGLVLAVAWAAFLAVDKLAAGPKRKPTFRAAASVAVLLLLLYAWGTHNRNKVWSTDESLWLDDVEKCPHNGRGLMNYGLTLMARGAYPDALDSFQRALLYTPNYPTLEINLGVVYGAMNLPAQAELHYRRAIALAPADDEAHYYFGRWLYQTGSIAEAVEQLQTAVQLNPSRLPARDLLATAYLSVGDAARARSLAAQTLRIESGDSSAKAILTGPTAQSADQLINASLFQYRSGNYAACIASAKQALALNPKSALAYNNIGAAYAAMRQWDLAIQNEQAALRIDSGLEIAKNNLALYVREKAGAASPQPATLTAEDWLNASLRDNQAGQYRKSIEDAQAALRLRPNYAEAYNNMAASYSSIGKWDQAIAAAQKAVALKPDFQLAKNNLAWALSQKKLGAR